MEHSLEDLSINTKDWAYWDDTYMFAQGLDDGYTEANLYDGNFEMYDVDVMMFVDSSDRVLYGKQKDFKTEEVKDIDAEVLNQLFGLNIFKNKNPGEELSAYIVVDEKPMMIASYPILKTGGSGTAMGNVMFGKIMDISMMEEISDKMGLKTSVKLIEKESFDLDEINDCGIQINVMDNKYVTGSIYLPEIANKEYIKISVEMPREVMEVGKTAMWYLMGLLPLILLATLFMLLYDIDKLVFSRVTNLSSQVIAIKEKNDISGRVDVDDGHDEISHLSKRINQMLEGLENLQLEITDAKKTLETKVVERTQELETANNRLEVEIIERQKIQAEVTFLAYHDTLTGLPNRRLFTDRVNQVIKSANRQETTISIMFIDLDGFKNINDTLGHNQGDQVLKQVADRLSKIVRRNDTVCRIGGDEFVLLINGYTDENNLDTIALKIIDSFKTPFIFSEQEYYITGSMGIAQYPVDGEDVETLMKNADLTMYDAKTHGKNQYQKCSKG
jgi:diguanylate cyclase (GGDEF)-like protein